MAANRVENFAFYPCVTLDSIGQRTLTSLILVDACAKSITKYRRCNLNHS
jgi:hypothetical protein